MSQLATVNCTLEMVYRFNRPTQAVAFYHHANPARARYFNLLEPERGNPPYVEQFSGLHPHDVWASVAAACHKTRESIARGPGEAFNLYYLFPQHLSKTQVAHLLGLSTDDANIKSSIRKVNRWLEKAMEYLETELINRGLLEPNDG